LVLLALATVMTMSVGVDGAAPAGSHARVTGTDPVDGAVVTELPERVTVFLGTKPATMEGDPVRVHGPDGARVDAGDAALVHLGGDDRAAAAVSVGLDREAVEAAGPGELRVAYRVVSEDSHLIAGSFGFTYEPLPAPAAGPGADGGAAGVAGVAGVAGPAGAAGAAGEGREAASGPMARQEPQPGQWPKIVFGGGVVLAAVGALGRRWVRGRRDAARRLEAVAARRESVSGGYTGGGGYASGGYAGAGRVGAGVGGVGGAGGFGTRPWTD
jgi:methionine-rich copper-binding protein CopC